MKTKSNNFSVNDFVSDDVQRLIYSGKVRDVYHTKTNNQLEMVATDKLSAFDRHITNIPYKGIILNHLIIV